MNKTFSVLELQYFLEAVSVTMSVSVGSLVLVTRGSLVSVTRGSFVSVTRASLAQEEKYC